ncbi:MAG: helix-turn-helix domain-containing protein [Candidatus Thiodiazotropha endolucinida]
MLFADFTTRKPTKEMLIDARENARLTLETAAELCGCHRTTYTRMESGSSKVNVACFRLLMMAAGWLPAPFEGWSIGQGKLWSPEDVSFEPGEIKAIPYLYAIIADYERELGIPNRAPAVAANVVPLRRKKK